MIGLPDSYFAYIAIPVGYIIGSISGAYIIGKLMGKLDITDEGDGRISASAIYKRLGRLPFLLVVIIDVSKALFTTLLTGMLTNSLILMLLVGFAIVIGHNWSIFLKFKGGLGATVTWGVLGGIVIVQLLIAFIPTLIFILIKRKSGIATAIGIISLSIILLLQNIFGWNLPPYKIPAYLIIYPIILIMFMIIKKIQIKRNQIEETAN